jgi:hypothetical protein
VRRHGAAGALVHSLCRSSPRFGQPQPFRPEVCVNCLLRLSATLFGFLHAFLSTICVDPRPVTSSYRSRSWRCVRCARRVRLFGWRYLPTSLFYDQTNPNTQKPRRSPSPHLRTGPLRRFRTGALNESGYSITGLISVKAAGSAKLGPQRQQSGGPFPIWRTLSQRIGERQGQGPGLGDRPPWAGAMVGA